MLTAWVELSLATALRVPNQRLKHVLLVQLSEMAAVASAPATATAAAAMVARTAVAALMAARTAVVAALVTVHTAGVRTGAAHIAARTAGGLGQEALQTMRMIYWTVTREVAAVVTAFALPIEQRAPVLLDVPALLAAAAAAAAVVAPSWKRGRRVKLTKMLGHQLRQQAALHGQRRIVGCETCCKNRTFPFWH